MGADQKMQMALRR